MKRWALLNGAVCVNVVEQAGMPTIGGQWLDVTGLNVGPGSMRSGSTWSSAPAVPSIAEVSMRQAKLALLAAGRIAAVEAAIASLDGPERAAAEIEWMSTGTVRRDHPTVAFIGAAAAFTPAEIDDLFAAAALIP